MNVSFQPGRLYACRLANDIQQWMYPTYIPAGRPFLAEKKLELEAYRRITQYRLLSPDTIKNALIQLASSLADGGLAGVTKSTSEYSLFIGTKKGANIQSVISTFPDICMRPADSDGKDPIFGNYPFGGVVCGIPTEAKPDWDAFFRAMPEDSVLALLISKASDTLREDIAGLLTSLGPYQKKQLPSGFNGQKVREIEDVEICTSIRQLERLSERLEREDSTPMSVCLWYAAKSRAAAEQCGNRLAACLRAVAQPLDDTTWCFDGFYYPHGAQGTCDSKSVPRAFQNPFTSIRTASEVAWLLPIPQDSLPGLNVLRVQRDEKDHCLFDIAPHSPVSGDSIRIGTIVNGTSEAIPLSLINRHVLLAGINGSGKSTALTTMICELYKKGLPVLILEPVKFDEFNILSQYGVASTVFSTGQTGKPLRFNPLIPERFTTILSHVKSLVAALTVFDNQAPIPQALELCLGSLYQRYGWSLDETVVSYSTKKFPTLPELLNYVLPYLQKECPLYRGDARVNVSSALYTRLNQLANYQFLRGTEKLPVEDFLRGVVRIQFDGLQEASDKSFFGLFLLNAVNTRLRNEETTGQLKRILIVDEAHNLFLKGKEGSLQSTTAAIADSLLSEIRGYGAGVILADQRPAALTEHAIANTAVKIVFSLSHPEDLESVTSQLHLSDAQKRQISSLPTGYAVVSVAGSYQNVLVHIDKPAQIARRDLAMCRFCPYTHICTRDSVEKLASNLPIDAYAQQLAGALENGHVQQTVQSVLSSTTENGLLPVEQRCLYGTIVERLQSVPMRNYLCSIYKD